VKGNRYRIKEIHFDRGNKIWNMKERVTHFFKVKTIGNEGGFITEVILELGLED
jgi:hypothetical protein